MKNKLLLIIFIIIYSNQLFSQENAGNNWYFGNRCGVTFNTGIPVALSDGVLNQLEGVSSISNEDGELLFYSDGQTIWDNTHQAMPNANGSLDGHFSSTQSSIIAPNLSDNSKFYIFTIDELGGSNGLKYSTVDMTLTGNGTPESPLGDVIISEKNIPLVSPIAEKITLVLKSNNTDYWVIVHGWGNNNFYVFDVTSSGVNTVYQTYSIGDIHSGNTINTVGYMKSSKNGNKIALVNRTTNKINLFDFNRFTGEISNPVNITPFNSLIFGLEFSFDETFLFIGGATTISKYNLSDQTHTELSFDDNTIFSAQYSAVRALQIAPNGNIYVSVRYNNYLSMIDPSNNFIRSNELFLDIDNTGRNCRFGLPDIFYYKGFEFFTGSEIDITICQGDSIYFQNHWQIEANTYYDTLTSSLGWDSIINTNLEISELPTTPTITENLGLLTSSVSDNYQWFLNGDTINGEISQEYLPLIDGTYQVSTKNINACESFSDEYNFVFNSYIYPEIDTTICQGDSIYLQNHWQIEANTYYDTLTSSLGWDSIIITNLEISEFPTIPTITENLGLLTSSVSDNYQWFLNGDAINGEISQEYLPLIDGTYQVSTENINACESFSEDYLFVIDGINNLNNNFKVYPNPFPDFFVIESNENFEIIITDIKGQNIFINHDKTLSKKVDLSNIKVGIYFLKIITNNTTTIKKIIKTSREN